MNKHRPGFTLTELLTVIAIIGILSGLIFPIVLDGLRKADAVKSIANLKHIGDIAHIYSADNKFKALPANDEVDGNNGGIETWLEILAYYATHRSGKSRYYTDLFTDSTWQQGGDPDYDPELIGVGLNVFPGLPQSRDRNDVKRGRHFSLSSIKHKSLRILAIQWDTSEVPLNANFSEELEKMKLDRSQSSGINAVFFDGHTDTIDDAVLLRNSFVNPAQVLREKMR